MRVVICTAGTNIGKMAREVGYKQDELVGIASENKEIWGCIEQGLYIGSLEGISDVTCDIVVVNADLEYASTKEKLVSYHISEEKIIPYKNYRVMRPRNVGSMKADFSKGIMPEELYDELCLNVGSYSKLEKEFLVGEHNRSFKWLHYFEIYNRYFSKYYDKNITIMEIGVNAGGSLQLWKKMFGPKAKIIGVDINPKCKDMEDDQIQIFIGDQEDRKFWESVKKQIPRLDILLDDGGHEMRQQIVTLEEMYPWVKEDGIYMIEDTGTSYDRTSYKDTGLRRQGTFMEYSKNLIDYLYAWLPHYDFGLSANNYTKTMFAISFYFGVVAIEKRRMYAPIDMEVTNTAALNEHITHIQGLI